MRHVTVLLAGFAFMVGGASKGQAEEPTAGSALAAALQEPAAASDVDQCQLCPRAWFESDHAFDDFISPVTNPVWFEDPRSLTQVRGVFINQQIPEKSILGGGDFQVYGMQAWLALSDRFALVAPKDGFVSLQADGIPHEDGWADIATGFKYVFIRDECERFLLTGGLIYEWAQGSREVFQGNGDGVWNFFLSTGKGIGRGHFLGAAGWHLPNDGAEESQSLWYSLHLDYEVCDGWYPLWELNGIHYTRSGDRLPGVNVEGGDLINFGAGDVAGNDFVSTAVGLAKVFSPHLILSGAWEFPVTDREDLFDNRVTITLTLRY